MAWVVFWTLGMVGFFAVLARGAGHRRPASIVMVAPPAAGLVEISGEVVADGLAHVARCTIAEAGRPQRHRGHRWIEWTELDRSVTARPFVIRTADGDVEVDTASLALRTRSLTPIDTGPLARRRVASIFPGEHVVATGTLRCAGGYRDRSGAALVPATGRIVLSTIPAAPPPPREGPPRR